MAGSGFRLTVRILAAPLSLATALVVLWVPPVPRIRTVRPVKSTPWAAHRQGHVDGLERPLFQERPGIRLRGQGAQVVPVAAEHFMDELGVRVSKSAADESIFHYDSSLR